MYTAFNHGLRKHLHFRRHNEYYTNTTVGTSNLYTFSSEKSLRSGKIIIMNLRLCPTHTQFDACGWLLNAIHAWKIYIVGVFWFGCGRSQMNWALM